MAHRKPIIKSTKEQYWSNGDRLNLPEYESGGCERRRVSAFDPAGTVLKLDPCINDDDVGTIGSQLWLLLFLSTAVVQVVPSGGQLARSLVWCERLTAVDINYRAADVVWTEKMPASR